MSAAPLSRQAPVTTEQPPVKVNTKTEKVRAFAQKVFFPVTFAAGLAKTAITKAVTVIKAIAGVPFKIAAYVSGTTELDKNLKGLRDLVNTELDQNLKNLKGLRDLVNGDYLESLDTDRHLSKRIHSIETGGFGITSVFGVTPIIEKAVTGIGFLAIGAAGSVAYSHLFGA